jgi:hypothetical protein
MGGNMSMRCAFKRKSLLIGIILIAIISAIDPVTDHLATANGSATGNSFITLPGSINRGLIPSDLFKNYLSWRRLDFRSLPPSRLGFSLTVNPLNNIAIMFGGLMTTTGETIDLWLTDGISWIRWHTPHTPLARERASMVFDTARSEVVLYGGFDNPITYGDT